MKLYRRLSKTAPWEVAPPEDMISFQKEGYLYRYFSGDAEAALNEEHPEVSLGEYSKFSADYYRTDLGKHLRFGQAFVNEVLPAGVVDPQLFYTTNVREAEMIIASRYIKSL